MNDRRNASLPQQPEKPAVTAIDRYLIRRKEEVPSIIQKDTEKENAILPPTKVVSTSAETHSIASISEDDSKQLISDESSNR